MGDEVYVEEYKEAQMPVCPVSKPALPPDGTYSYTFLFWDKDITSVTADTDYTAVFKKTYLIPIGNHGAAMNRTEGGVSIDLRGTDADTVDISPVLDALSGNSLCLVTSVGTVYFDSDEVGRMLDGGVRKIGIVTGGEGTRFDFTVTLEGVGRASTLRCVFTV